MGIAFSCSVRYSYAIRAVATLNCSTRTMQITITIPDELVAEAESRGITLEAHVGHLIAEHFSRQTRPAPHKLSAEQFEAALDELTQYSEQIPLLPAQH
jgi:hypothetical protein